MKDERPGADLIPFGILASDWKDPEIVEKIMEIWSKR